MSFKVAVLEYEADKVKVIQIGTPIVLRVQSVASRGENDE